jgi:hypothetical protein
LLHGFLVFQFKAQQIGNLTENLDVACKVNHECGKSLWLLSSLPLSLVAVLQSLERRDPAENIYYSADSILQKVSGDIAQFFRDDPLAKAVSECAITLQYRQRLSISISLMTRLLFALFSRNETAAAVAKLREALECHFRLVHAHSKVGQILAGPTKEAFHQNHSWAGCLSISVMSSLLARYLVLFRADDTIRLLLFETSLRQSRMSLLSEFSHQRNLRCSKSSL